MTVFGVEDSENEAGAMQDALTEFGKANGIDITYVGRRDFEQQINAQVLADNPPDIAAFPQPGKLKQFAQDGKLLAGSRRRRRVRRSRAGPTATWRSPTSTAPSTACRSSPTSSRSCGTSRASGRQKGYEVPKTLTEFNALMDKMIANGDTPLCVGIESGTATGWPFTDWVEELVLRQQGIDYYNQWVDHEIPFNDQPVIDTFNQVAGPDGYWKKNGAVFASGGSIAATAFGDNGPSARRGQVHDASPGELLQRLLPRGHQVRRRRR